MSLNFPYILAVGTALPLFKYKQEDLALAIGGKLALSTLQQKKLTHIFSQSHILHRHSVLQDFSLPSSRCELYHTPFAAEASTKKRNLLYQKYAPALALKAAERALAQWHRTKKSLTHVIFVSCTGLYAPGIECFLLQALDLSPYTARLSLNFMGCFGAFKGLAMAYALAQENPLHRVLVVCAELCTLHLQAGRSTENFVHNALFADGASAAIVGQNLQEGEEPLWQIKKFLSFLLPDSQKDMTWHIGNTGFEMQLHAAVPSKIRQHIASFVERLQGPTPSRCWAVHPGGKAILQAAQQALSLTTQDLAASHHVLQEHGNMSSATFLFVLQRLLQHKQNAQPTIGLGFGPGLSIEGIALQ